MRALLDKHKDSIIRFTDLDFERIRKITYLYEFDREVQCVLSEWKALYMDVEVTRSLMPCRCATWGYPTEEAYYRDASSSDSVLAIRIPFFALHAADDPVSPPEEPGFGNVSLTFRRLLSTMRPRTKRLSRIPTRSSARRHWAAIFLGSRWEGADGMLAR